ncbi:hypothetical protein PPMP20_34890 [Paraburkholderia phymatum]|uniref:Double-GTPase 2 domain-containing protein n=1 Tax=Paraburkholderia phymatum (strain DSM 17167 / CIP 108236 / LMG 21445 / STM815) TaxID=391038 RepID=B2JXC5_PARP8|nr:hypothetical protein [Paraburkholderia phymatum]ACC76283.1 hypothetical protein Bphy_7296 [Paraburkholderia phymatum STM815]
MEVAPEVKEQLKGKCTAAGCNAPTDRCIEGLAPVECPNFVVGPEIDEVSFEAERPVDQDNVVRVSRVGWALTVDDADGCMLSTPAGRRLAVVSLVGVPDCGKTTLVSSLYEIVRRNLATKFGFAGSETIHGFEERCHLSRLASDRESPDTPRTARELQFLHMSVADRECSERVELFMADRRGEQFQDVLNRPPLSETLVEVRRGDAVAFLLDGEHLIDGSKRESAISKVHRLAMALKDVIRQSIAIQLVITKTDKIQGHDDEPLVRRRVDALSSQLGAMLPAKSRYSVHYVAARNLDDESNGMHRLLSEWLQVTGGGEYERPAPPIGKSAFERLMNLRGASI